jgi:hypothetical protein
MAETADPEIEALVAAFYAAFDNRGGREPAAGPLRALFAEAAIVTRVTDGEAQTWTADEFIAPRIALLNGGGLVEFREWEVEGRTRVERNIASRWSLYEKQGTLDGAHYRGAGRKFIQLHRSAGAWRISSVLWEDD